MKLKDYVSKLCFYLGLKEEETEININENKSRVVINIEIPHKIAGYYIGNNGEALKALERQIRLVFRDDYEDMKIVLDINKYQAKKEEEFKNEIRQIAKDVLETEKPFKLEGLNSYERYQIHTMITDEKKFSSLTTISQGESPNRVLIIDLK